MKWLLTLILASVLFFVDVTSLDKQIIEDVSQPLINDPSLFDCSWTTSTGYTIDLSQLYGAVLVYSSNKSSYKYYYSPCNDGVICTQNSSNVDTMAIQDDGNGFCVSYLAKFDAFVEPVYSVASETFTFEYNNGEISGICDHSRQLIIQWICDPNYEYKIDSVTEVASCIYELSINSCLACVNNSEISTTQIPSDCEFGMYDYYDSDAIESEGWSRMSLDDLEYFYKEFKSYYNKNEGIKCIKAWDTCNNCCFPLNDDEVLGIGNPQRRDEYFAYPAIAPDTLECCVTGFIEGQTYIFSNSYQFWTNLTNVTLIGVEGCYRGHNPGLYQKNCS